MKEQIKQQQEQIKQQQQQLNMMKVCVEVFRFLH